MSIKVGRPTSGRSRQQLRSEESFCAYTHRCCMQPRVDGFEFCLSHILEDKNSPYKQCNYVSNKTGKRCTNAAPKSDRREGYVKVIKIIQYFVSLLLSQCVIAVIGPIYTL